MNKEFYVIVFASTHQAIQTEKEMIDKVKVQMIPTLREISAHCGVSLKFQTDFLEEVKAYLQEHAKDGMDLYHVEGELGSRVVTKVEW